MKVCVLNGSPKGMYSITLQTVLYLQKKYPKCEFEIIHVGQKIRVYEKDMSEALTAIERAELMLFCYPVYTFIAPYQLQRFIELLKEKDIDLSHKYAAQITTSKHFYDVTAHNYIKENCLDMGLRYIEGLSADMDDLLKEQGRADAVSFWNYVLYSKENNIYEVPSIESKTRVPDYISAVSNVLKEKDIPKKEGHDTVIVTNCEADDNSLAAMLSDFQVVYPYKTRVINIAEYPFAGGCLGCLNCAGNGKCIYKDGFDTFLREEIQTESAIVYAFTIKDHSMGASFKQYDDRQFCNGHRTVTMGMPMGYLIHGDYQSETNLQMIVQGRCEVGHNYLAGTATDSQGIERLSTKLVYALENKLVLPQNFLGVGGTKIFRDLIYMMRGFMKADHRFYKEHGIYDFPQKQIGTILKMKLVGGMINNPKIKAKMGNKMNEGMIAPYKKAIEKE